MRRLADAVSVKKESSDTMDEEKQTQHEERRRMETREVSIRRAPRYTPRHAREPALDLRWNNLGIALCAGAIVLLLFLLVWMVFRGGGREDEPEEVTLREDIQEDFLTVNEWSRPGDPLEQVNGLVIHYVGNPGTSAQANRNYFESLAAGTDGVYASSHFIVGLNGEIVQCIPLTEIAYASNTRNSDTIAIEVCHPDETGMFSSITYNALLELAADLCIQYDLDPMTDVIRHYDVTEKLCPLYYVEHEDAWERLRSGIAAVMERQQSES